LPSDAAAGTYDLSIGIVSDDNEPVIRLAIAGRDSEGWYPVGQLDVR